MDVPSGAQRRARAPADRPVSARICWGAWRRAILGTMEAMPGDDDRVDSPPGAAPAGRPAPVAAARGSLESGPAATVVRARGSVDTVDPTRPVAFAARAPVPEPLQVNTAHRREVVLRAELPIPERLGRFELIREIGRGGMGRVFLGRDTRLGRKVAIKFLLRHDPHFVQRFLVEARATARCTHENIVTIFEVGEHDGLPYMVLEYLEGRTLADILEVRPTAHQLVELMIPVVRALARAHEHGIVHRDLKPSNILVTDRGQLKVLDFGVAQFIDGDADPSPVADADSLVGTYPYMSPEQWGAGEVDHLSDLWAIGVMFWRALTGEHPAGTTTPELLRERLCDRATALPSLASADAKIPRDVVRITDRCLAKRKSDRYQSASELLVDLERALAPEAAVGALDDAPYRGLVAFGEDDARRFFGRSSEIRAALAQLATWPLLAVIGASGVGKSSFVHAGLIPALRSGTGGGSGAWDVHTLRPGRDPLRRLAAILDDGLDVAELRVAPGSFGARLRERAKTRRENVLVVVDQMEEVFTLCEDASSRAGFLAALLAAADDARSPVRVVLSMRADFLDRLASDKQVLADVTRGLFFLSVPDADNLRETLVRPAELAGYAFEASSIVDDMIRAGSTSGALPLVSFAAARLWDGRDRERRLLTVKAYEQLGGVGGAFARHADHVASTVPTQHQPLLRAIMTRLVTPEGTRAVVEIRELASLSEDAGAIDTILELLVRGRLVHARRDAGQEPTVEIVHEALITEWPTLTRWLDEQGALRGFLDDLRRAARQWDARDRAPDVVWRGRPAREALDHASRNVLELSRVEREFLDGVRAHVRRERRRKVAAVAAIAAVVAIGLAGSSVAVVRIKRAEGEAELRADQTEHALAEAKAARDQLQSKLDLVEQKEREREAEAARRSEEEQRRAVAEQGMAAARRDEQLTKEQLAQANVDLRAKVAQAQAAEAAAKRATQEAQAAKRQLEILLAAKRAEVERLEAERKNIYDGSLKAPKGR